MRFPSGSLFSLFLFFFLFLAALTAPNTDPKGSNKTLAPWYALCEKSGFFSGSTVKPAHPNTPPGLEHIMEDLSSICMEIKRFLIDNGLPLSSVLSGDTSPPAGFTEKTTIINIVCGVASFILSLYAAISTYMKNRLDNGALAALEGRVADLEGNEAGPEPEAEAEPEGNAEAEAGPVAVDDALRRRVGKLERGVGRLNREVHRLRYE